VVTFIVNPEVPGAASTAGPSIKFVIVTVLLTEVAEKLSIKVFNLSLVCSAISTFVSPAVAKTSMPVLPAIAGSVAVPILYQT
jgi:hypothetical protein